ncbi:MAG: glycine--tRNA ligase subunit beta [Vicinamibacterales bacterium]
MDRELLIEIGCEEIPASWLPSLTRQIGEHLAARLVANRLRPDAPVETFSTPRRLVAVVSRVPERQTDLEELLMGPPVSAAWDATGGPSPAAAGFARRHGVEVAALEQVDTPKGPYLAYRRRQRGKAAVDVLPDVLAGLLRDMTFPKQMRWDAMLEDGRGELMFGRPIRWLLFLYGGRVVPFEIRRTPLGQSPLVQDVRSAAITYGHRFLATSGRSGRAIKVRSFDEYRSRLLEHFVVLDRGARHDKIARELDAHARRLGGRVSPAVSSRSTLLEEVPDLVEYPSVIAGTFAAEFLELPEEVLTTTLMHHQHYFPVVNDAGKLMPAFLAVVNTQPDNSRVIARNSERVVTARLRDARFFWDADRETPLASRLERLDTVLFHKALGTYRAKAERIETLARWIACEMTSLDAVADEAALAARLAKTDLTTEMVREFTELQGTMGGIYARLEGYPETVWRAISLHYLPQAVEPSAPPSREDIGPAAAVWAAVALADKVDTLAGLFAAGEKPTGTRDPFGLRRQAHGALRILYDLPELVDGAVRPSLQDAVQKALSLLPPTVARHGRDSDPQLASEAAAEKTSQLAAFLRDRLRYLLEQRGFAYDEINSVLRPGETGWAGLDPLDTRRRLEALRAVRGSPDFEALAVAFKRVKNLSRELSGPAVDAALLREPAERALVEEYEKRGAEVRRAIASRDYQAAFRLASGFRPAIDRFFSEIFVMVDDPDLRAARLSLVRRLHELLLGLADVSEIVPRG